jgi:nitrite reductase/ring-hydroxylating ferredoxin subunit|tara:strand:+ start:968 stop:1777 length:810 start_codon:yes stop_codon:yes gene_type:complete
VVELRYEFVPGNTDSGHHVGSYRRRLPVSLVRMYENALDWEHLPHLHESSFSDLELLDSGAWGWRAKVVDQRKGTDSIIELRLDRAARRWITRNLEGPAKGVEIWTHVFELTPQSLDIIVDFFVPDVDVAQRDKVGRAYARAYEVLYDEDVRMMTERQQQLDRRIDAVESADSLMLGAVDEITTPLTFSLSDRFFVLQKVDAEWVVYPQRCPHQLGPLALHPDTPGQVHCSWHGYRFDLQSGECLGSSNCRLGRRPQVQVQADQLTVHW